MTGATRDVLYRLVIDLPTNLAELVAAELFEHGLRGLEEQDIENGARLIIYGDDRRQIEIYAKRTQDILGELAEFEPAAREAVVTIDEQKNADWATDWMKHFRQTVVTPTIVVQPTWEKTPAPPGTRALIIEPKMAFGFGTHATTQLAACGVERFFSQHPGGRLLDVGTGTGILALVALLNGAQTAEGIDIDPVAVECATENAGLNGLADRCRFSLDSLTAFTEPFPLVMANITAPSIVEMAEDLARLTAPGGRLALTGILTAGRQDVLLPFSELGFGLTFMEDQDEWCLLELART